MPIIRFLHQNSGIQKYSHCEDSQTNHYKIRNLCKISYKNHFVSFLLNFGPFILSSSLMVAFLGTLPNSKDGPI